MAWYDMVLANMPLLCVVRMKVICESDIAHAPEDGG